MAIRKFRRSNNRNRGRRNTERKALCVLFIFAWAWILGFLGVVAWHLRKSRAAEESKSSTVAASSLLSKNRDAHSLNIKSIPVDESQTQTKRDNIVMEEHDSPVLIFACKRAQYLSGTLDDLFKNIPRPCHFGCPIVVSQDGDHPDVDTVLRKHKERFESVGVPFYHIHHKPNLRVSDPYKKLAQHYGWALKELFDGKIDSKLPLPQRVIILEEDIHTSPDFFSYMEATSKILDIDPTLFAVSAFNDNGQRVSDPRRLLRSDFFPGLGWMMTRSLWKKELEPKWPEGFWDDWLREPSQRLSRQVIRPEISRTYHFGQKGGASHNQFGSLLERVKLNHRNVDWSKEDLSYLVDSNFATMYQKVIDMSKRAASVEEARDIIKIENANLQYSSFRQFQQYARQLDIMSDEKARVPRTAYKGVVETRLEGENLLFLIPSNDRLMEYKD